MIDSHILRLLCREAVSWRDPLWLLHQDEPLTAKVEITRRCNLNCRMCLRPNLPVYPDMTFKQLKRVIEQLRHIKVFSPHGYGEPLIHPEWLEMMQYVSDRDISISLVTNGVLLKKNRCRDFLETCKVRHISFSIDGVGQSYEWIRRGSNWKNVLQNLKDALETRKRVSPETTICIYSVLGSFNWSQILPLSYVAKQLDLDYLSFMDLTPHGTGLSGIDDCIRHNRFYSFGIPRFIEYCKTIFPRIIYKLQSEKYSCTLPWSHTFVQANGDVFVCTDNLDGSLGNIFQQSFHEIWHGPLMRWIRNNFTKHPLEACSRCINFPLL